MPDEEVDLSFETSGKIVSVSFKEGTRVSKGQLLAKVNDKPLQAQLKRLMAQLELAKNRVFRQKQLLKKDGVSQETYEEAQQRLRPILMTSTSTILGLIPLAFATGEGCNQRIAMGIAVVGGMLVSTFMTMFIVPSIYSYISTDRKMKPATPIIILALLFCGTQTMSAQNTLRADAAMQSAYSAVRQHHQRQYDAAAGGPVANDALELLPQQHRTP